MLELTKQHMEEFREDRQEVMDLGLTEEQYNRMIEAGVNWICEINTLIQNYIILSEAKHDMIHAVINNTAKVMQENLEYAFRLLRWLYDPEKYDLEQFKKDRKALLQILKSDWLTNPEPSTFKLRLF